MTNFQIPQLLQTNSGFQIPESVQQVYIFITEKIILMAAVPSLEYFEVDVQMLLCLWETVLCLSGDSSGCCRNAVFKNMGPRRFWEKLMIQLLLSTAGSFKGEKNHLLGQIFVKAAMFVQFSPLCLSSCWWSSPPMATPALLIFQQADIKTSTSMLTLLTLGHFWQRFKGGQLQILEAVNQQNMTLWRTERDNWRLPTWSDSHLMPAAMKQHPSWIFHSLSYVQAFSSPIAAPVVASLFMRSPICYHLNSPTWNHQVGHVINSSITWKLICSEMFLSPLEQAACTVWLREILISSSEIRWRWRWRKKLIN